MSWIFPNGLRNCFIGFHRVRVWVSFFFGIHVAYASMKTNPFRILVTGERYWTNRQQVFAALENAVRFYNSQDIVIVHGGCKTGADRFAREFCEENGIKQEVHEADWDKHGKRAGPVRNQEMVELGAILVLAFWSATKTTGSGTFHCLTQAIKAGIKVVVYPRIT